MLNLTLSLEAILATVELILLIATFILLITSRKEWKGRRQLLNILYTAVRVLTRHEYFTIIVEGVETAKKSIFATITGMPPTEEEEPTVSKIVRLIKKVCSKGVETKYLIPIGIERLNMGCRLSKAGAEVRYSKGLVVYDLRYMVIDDRHVILGLPEKVGEGQPTKKGYILDSETLARLLREHFKRHWDDPSTISYEDYLLKVVKRIIEANPGISPRLMAKQLNIDVSEAEKAFRKAKIDKK